MKCPCCDNQIDVEFIVLHNVMHMADGTNHRIQLGAGRLLTKLVKGPVTRPDKYSSFDVYLHFLREFLEDTGMPFKIVYAARTYTLKRNVL